MMNCSVSTFDSRLWSFRTENGRVVDFEVASRDPSRGATVSGVITLEKDETRHSVSTPPLLRTVHSEVDQSHYVR